MAASVQSCVLQVNHIQRMIDINASNLDGLRTQCTAKSDLIQQEIKDQEAKLVKLFSRMLMARQQIEAECNNHLDCHQYPRLQQWLNIVGISSPGVNVLVERYGSFTSLLAAEETQLKGVLHGSDATNKEAEKLISALKNLREHTEQRKAGNKSSSSGISSWSSARESGMTLQSTSSLSDSAFLVNGETTASVSDTPQSQANSPKLLPSPLVNIKRSKSDELANKPNLEALCLSPGGSLGKNKGRNLCITLPNCGSFERINGEKASNRHSSSSGNSNSPKTPTRVNIGDKHKFSSKQIMIRSQCFLCKGQIFRGVKCEDCGLRFHKKCSKRSASGCELLKTINSLNFPRGNKYYTSLPSRVRVKRTSSEPSNIAWQLNNPPDETLTSHTSHGELFQNSNDHRKRGYKEPPAPLSFDQLLTTSLIADAVLTQSTTSTPQHSPPPNTNTPSVPASAPPQNDHNGNDRRFISARSVRRRKGLAAMFFFPDENDESNEDDDLVGTETSRRKDSVLSSESTVSVQSNDSTLSGGDAATMDPLESQISDYDSLTRTWSSKRWERESHLSEWTIPFHDIELQDRIGVGRIGEVYRGNWHGQVAVKVIEIQQPTAMQLQAFKIQVQTFRKTRHENLVLFMGACMEPPKLAIITSLCKGYHLYNRIHVFKETLPVAKVMLILKQIAQGMSYLHSRGIIHADLKSKNIFFENDSKVVITDFGHLRLAAGLSVEKTRLGRVKIPRGWLNYLAPEIVCSLSPYQPLHKRMFTKESDVYAFGTVCYELLSGSWPFSDYPLETIIYQVGKGAKQSLSKLDVVREMKDIINLFWACHPGKRPNFKNISKILDKIPVTKGRLYRSPSQPVTRTLEATF